MIKNGFRNNATLSACTTMTEALGTLIATTERRLQNAANIETCIEGYLKRATYALLPISKEHCRKAFEHHIKHDFVALLFKDSVVSAPVGFLIAARGSSDLTDARLIQQIFYNASLEGILAVKAVWLLHRLMLRYARLLKYDYAVSICSPVDTEFVFNKILTKDGWTTVGHTSILKV